MEIKWPISLNLPKHGRGPGCTSWTFVNKEKNRLTFKNIDENDRDLLDYDFQVECVWVPLSAWTSHAGWGKNKDEIQMEDSNAFQS